ncbi:MAG: efflux RND transporter permease subunit [Aestuariivita sp.]|nr:efflux RND transporter permease subunit [Aestuariivita sp.]MCY4347137.1 efflux RND transporter permease subunit [Aestuariivita sp.]
MTNIIDWVAKRARMVLAFIIISLIAGGAAYSLLPKEGEPEIDIPVLFVSVPFPGISAEDSERLLVKSMETELADLDGLTSMWGTASEGYAGLALEFEFGWDKAQTIADIRDGMKNAEENFPDGAEQYSINEIDEYDVPIMIINSGGAPERTLRRAVDEMKEELESLEPVREVIIVGQREEILEVIVNPVLLEAYDIPVGQLLQTVAGNNQTIAAGEIETGQGAFALRVPSGYNDFRDVYDLPIKVSGDSVITLGDLADVRLTFTDRTGTARFNGTDAIGLYVFKRPGYSVIETSRLTREKAAAVYAAWPEPLQQAITIGTSNRSLVIVSMIDQLEGSVLTAIALVMIVVLAALGPRASLLVGFAIPTSFLLCFAFLAVMSISISNMVLFGLILAVGMLVDGAVVVVEYADRRIHEGSGPMHAYVEAAKRMFWPIVSSTATTLCAFLPMLFWPGVTGEFMGTLPVTMIFVLSASLVVALIYIPVIGGIAGRLNRRIDGLSIALQNIVPYRSARFGLVLIMIYIVFLGAMQLLSPDYLFGSALADSTSPLRHLPGIILFLLGAVLTGITLGSLRSSVVPKELTIGRSRTLFGKFTQLIAGNPVMPIVSIVAIISIIVGVFIYYGRNNLGVEFFVETEPEEALIFVRARGNLSLTEKDAIIRRVEQTVLNTPGIDSVFATAGSNALQQDSPTVEAPEDTVGQLRIELTPWDDRPRQKGYPLLGGLIETESVLENYYGSQILNGLERDLARIPGIKIEIAGVVGGPPSGKPLHLRLRGDNFDELLTAGHIARTKFENTVGLIDIEDTFPLPGIDWRIDVDVEKAGQFGVDVATVGSIVQMVTKGIFLDTMRIDSSDEEIEIRVRLAEEYRVLSTLDTLKIRTNEGQVPLSNFITRTPTKKLGKIERFKQRRYVEVKANVADDIQKIVDNRSEAVVGYQSMPTETSPARLISSSSGISEQAILDGLADGSFRLVPVNATERINTLNQWLDTQPFAHGIDTAWGGDRERQAESEAFLFSAFAGALGLMFIILLAQFNSFYNATLVLLAIVLSTTGVMLGMLIMQQPFSVIMTGIGIVALAGIVVNNNIVLIDTYQEYTRFMPKIEAIVRTAEVRIRPVLMTSITTMAGLTPMMFGVSLDFIDGGYSVDSPTAIWWKQLATAVVFGLGTATILTLVFTPSMLALRVWVATYAEALARFFSWLSMPRSSAVARDWALRKAMRQASVPEIIWDGGLENKILPRPSTQPRALPPAISPAE